MSGETDGIIRTFDLFTAYALGYFVVEVLARDLAGHSDITNVGIYILRDDQRVKIVINEIPERVRLFQEEFVNLLFNIAGLAVCVCVCVCAYIAGLAVCVYLLHPQVYMFTCLHFSL